MIESHLLDNPVWNALTTKQAQFAMGSSSSALRFSPDLNALGATREHNSIYLGALCDLTPCDAQLALYTACKCVDLPGMVSVIEAPCFQMIADEILETSERYDVRDLSMCDAIEMVDLARLSRVGPFAPNAYKLGKFFGIRERGLLIGLVGQRLQMPGYTEISAVCTHPAARRRGVAKALVVRAMTEVLIRGDRPFLHVHVDNHAAVSLYERLGFRRRKILQFNLAYHN